VYAALGAAGVGTSPVAYGRAIASWFRARRGLALALGITGGAIGGMLHPPLTSALIQAVGWRGACVALGALVLVVGVPVVARFVRERPDVREPAREPAESSLGEGLRAVSFWLLVVVLFCGTMVQNAVIVHLAALLTDRGASPAQGAIALSAMAASAIVGRVVTGLVIDRVFAVRVLVVVMALAAIGAFLLAGAPTFGAGVIAAMLVGFGTGGEADVVPYLLTRYFGLRAFSSLYGFAWAANAIGGALGPILMGRTYDEVGSNQTILVRLAVALFAAALLALALPRYEAKGLTVAPA
jgi:predicted MFS family arabinose efflux permease